MEVHILVKVGHPLRPEELMDLERIAMAIEEAVSLALQVHFDAIDVEETRIISTFPDDHFSNGRLPINPLLL